MAVLSCRISCTRRRTLRAAKPAASSGRCRARTSAMSPLNWNVGAVRVVGPGQLRVREIARRWCRSRSHVVEPRVDRHRVHSGRIRREGLVGVGRSPRHRPGRRRSPDQLPPRRRGWGNRCTEASHINAAPTEPPAAVQVDLVPGHLRGEPAAPDRHPYRATGAAAACLTSKNCSNPLRVTSITTSTAGNAST
jgi:hypothetical protein